MSSLTDILYKNDSIPDEPHNWSLLNIREATVKDVYADNIVVDILTANNIEFSDIALGDIIVSDIVCRDIAASSISTNNINTNGAYIDGLVECSDISCNIAGIDTVICSDTLTIQNTYFVGSLESFRHHNLVSDGNMTVNLPNYASIYLTKEVDLQGYKIQCGLFNCIRGSGLEQSGLRSTGLSGSDWLVNTNSTITFNDMYFKADPLIDQNCLKLISSDGTSTIDARAINLYGFKNSMVLDNFDNCIFSTWGFISSSNINYQNSGTVNDRFGTVSWAESYFLPRTGENIMNFNSNCNITRRFRVLNSAFVNLGGVSLNIPSDIQCVNNGIQLLNCNFGGFGTQLAGLDYNDNRCYFKQNFGGIPNNSTIGEYYMRNNSDATIILNSSDYYTARGSASNGQFNQRFYCSDTTLRYTGTNLTVPIKIIVAGSIQSGNNNQIDMVITKNGGLVSDSVNSMTTSGTGRLESIGTFCTGLLTQSDYYSVAVRNRTSTTSVLIDRLHLLLCEI